MKYIDADRLNADLDKWVEAMADAEGDYSDGVRFAIQHFIFLLASLQQEQPEAICSKCIHHGKDDDYCYNPHGGMRSLINENGVYECTGFCEQEQPEVDLEVRKQIEELANDWHHKGFASDEDCPLCMQDLMDILWHFYELGKKDMKEQMLKDAVEGYVNYYEDSGGILMAEAQVGCPYHNGDKVKIIIIKDDEQNGEVY